MIAKIKKGLLKYFPPKEDKIIGINGVRFCVPFKEVGNNYIFRAMVTGEYEKENIDIMKSLLQEGDTFIDVGANIGYISAWAMSMAGKNGRIIAFEPVSMYYKNLVKLKELNQGYTLETVNAAASDVEGEAEIQISKSDNIGWNTMENIMNEEHNTETIKTVTLNDYLNEKVRLIKIDTEGHEFKVIKGALKYLESATKLPYIICEIAPQAHTNAEMKEFNDTMKRLGYKTKLQGKDTDITNIKKTTDILFEP